jgi:hypothetical protein
MQKDEYGFLSFYFNNGLVFFNQKKRLNFYIYYIYYTYQIGRNWWKTTGGGG